MRSLLLILSVSVFTSVASAQSLTIEAGRIKDGTIRLAGRDSGQQLVVTDAKASDWTQRVEYTATPVGIVNVSESGFVTARTEGTATVTAKAAHSAKASVRFVVTDIARDQPLHFANDIVPIFTRFGCNAGGCHGKSGGQNGFALSLLGFEPDEDYEFVVKENRGRRVFPASPTQSLLTQKAAGLLPHGGGRKLPDDSPFHRMLVRWIEQGMPRGAASDPVVTRIEVFPKDRMLARDAAQQLAVVAHLSDGSTRDVTRLAQFESNDADVATVSESGLVVTKDIPGTVAVMARFQSHVDAFRGVVPLGAKVASLPKANNFIDELVFAQLQRLGLPPSPVCDDATYLRRVTLDLAGRLPTLDESEAFLKNTEPNKREQLVDRLLASGDFADLFAMRWSAILRNKRHTAKEDPAPTRAFHGWIRNAIATNKPFDVFVREILTAQGEDSQTPQVLWYREVKDIHSQVEDAAQLFLGTRLQCARCHHHPLEKWSQDDYYGLAAFFSQVAYKVPPKADPKKGEKVDKNAKKITHVYHNPGVASFEHPRTKAKLRPTLLNGRPMDIAADADPRVPLADWITDPANPLFARTLANRTWKHFLGRGLVEPEDDLRATNPPTHPELLDDLAKFVVDSKFDVKALVRVICTSTTYQLSAEPNEHNAGDKQNYARFHSRRLPAEVLFDAIDQVTLAKSEFPGAPAGTRAVQLPDNAFESYFLAVFGRPDMSSACECERTGDVSLSQMLHLMNSYDVLAKISGKNPIPKTAKNVRTKVSPGDRLNRLISDKRGHDEKIRDLYLLAFGRSPTADEATVLRSHVERTPDVRTGYEDVLWVMLNSEDFLFNR